MDKQLQKYRGMIAVEQDYAKSGMSDSEFAKHISTKDVTYSRAMITQWRTILKIHPNAPLTAREQQMREIIRKLWPDVAAMRFNAPGYDELRAEVEQYL